MLLWFWISLLGLTSVEAQTFASIIFFLLAYNRHITRPKISGKKTVHCSTLKIKSITHRAKKSHRQVNYLDKSNPLRWFSSYTLNFQANVDKIFINPSKNLWNCIFFLTYDMDVTLAHYLKKEYLNSKNFSFEIIHTHLRRRGKTSADLAANFKLTNHTAADFQIDQSYGYRRAMRRRNITNSLTFYNLPFVKEKWPHMNSFPSVTEAKPSNLLQI